MCVWGHVLGQWNGLKTCVCMGSCVGPVEWTEDVYGVTFRCVGPVEWTEDVSAWGHVLGQ